MRVPPFNWQTIRRFATLLRAIETPQARWDLFVELSQRLEPPYRLKWPKMEWWADSAFTAYLERFEELNGVRFNSDRRWMLYQLQRLTANVPGDTAECGVFEGAGSYLICRANQRSTLHAREHHIFDSFEGLSDPESVDGGYWTRGNLSYPLTRTRQNLSEFNGVHYYQGWIPTRFSEVEGRKFSFVHIDVDLHAPTRDSLAFFYPRLSAGGILVCDDYRFTTCPGATRAIDEYLADKPESMIALADGGGFLIKGCPTAPEPL